MPEEEQENKEKQEEIRNSEKGGEKRPGAMQLARFTMHEHTRTRFTVVLVSPEGSLERCVAEKDDPVARLSSTI